MSMPSVEVIVIGGGVIGSSIAYHLARQGRSTLVLEKSIVASSPAASWASAGGVRRQGRHPAEALLAQEAIERWPSLTDELAADLHYQQGGNLLLAETDTEAEQLASFVRRQQEIGFTDVRLLDRQEITTLVPGLPGRVTTGSYSPSDGQADPALTTQAFAQAAQRLGAIYWQNTPALALQTTHGRVNGVSTARGPVQAEQVVLAAGAWSEKLLTPPGLSLPIRTRAFQMVLSTSAHPGLLKPVLSAVSRTLSLKQLRDGSFLLGGGWLGDPTADQNSYTLRQRSIEGNWKTASELLPVLQQQQIARAWCGLEAQSFDEIPFIGTMPGLDGLTIAVGFSGHGFAIAPAVGRAIADMLRNRPTPELDGLSPMRIAMFSTDEVEAFKNEPATSDYLD